MDGSKLITAKRGPVYISRQSVQPIEAIRAAQQGTLVRCNETLAVMSQMGQQRSLDDVRIMSVHTLRAARERTFAHFAFGPTTDIAPLRDLLQLYYHSECLSVSGDALVALNLAAVHHAPRLGIEWVTAV